MRYVTAQEGVVIPLGRQDETGVETVVFPTSAWAETYGEGTFTLVNKRATETAGYPCDITVDDDGNVNWLVEAADVFYTGNGCVQLTYTVGEAVAKSIIYSTSILPSLGGGDVPEQTPSWLQRVFDIGDEVVEAEQITTQKAQTATEAAESASVSAANALARETAADASAQAAALSATQAASFVGSPLTATTAAGMTDHAKVYVYTGSESGYTSGHWYYWTGSAWADGGVYNATAVNIATSADLQAALYS